MVINQFFHDFYATFRQCVHTLRILSRSKSSVSTERGGFFMRGIINLADLGSHVGAPGSPFFLLNLI